jgi:hypothetical protein
MNQPPNYPIFNADGDRIDPESGLPLPDPFPDYVSCPNCGEGEVEVWCFQAGGVCHNCGTWVYYPKPEFCGLSPYCKRAEKNDGDPGPQLPDNAES